MKLLKKNLFGISMACAMILGITFSFVPEVASANAEDEESDTIPCNSNAKVSNSHYYVPCDTCVSTLGEGLEYNSGTCTTE